MGVSGITQRTAVSTRESIDEQILVVLIEHGAHLLDEPARALPHIEAARLLLAVDRLRRVGRIAIGPPKNGDYLVWAMPESCPAPIAFYGVGGSDRPETTGFSQGGKTS